MKRVLVMIGPQGAGKSTFCKQIINTCPTVVLVSRDEILIKLFGTPRLDSYSGGHSAAEEEMWRQIEDHLKKDDSAILLDSWNGYPHERVSICNNLQRLGADTIEGCYFITPEDICVHQYERREQKPDEQTWEKESRERSCRQNYRLYHSMHISTDQGFNLIRMIDTAQLTLWPHSYLLNLT